jgi:hypothetical protein
MPSNPQRVVRRSYRRSRPLGERQDMFTTLAASLPVLVCVCLIGVGHKCPSGPFLQDEEPARC